MKVKNMVSSNGNTVPNQFIIQSNGCTVFQSYNSIIVKKENGKVYLDRDTWNYSRTTSKYRSQFLRETTRETQSKINSGLYILTNLN